MRTTHRQQVLKRCSTAKTSPVGKASPTKTPMNVWLLKGAALAEAQKTADKNMNEHWSVVEGILTYDGKGMSLCTDKDYGDFEFYCDWKIPPGADSGNLLAGHAAGANLGPVGSAHQRQIYSGNV